MPSADVSSDNGFALPWRTVTTAADIAMRVDKDGLVRAVAVTSRALLRDIGSRDEWLGRPLGETVTLQTRPVADSLLQALPLGTSRPMRHVDHLSAGGLPIPIVYAPLLLGGIDGETLLLGRDLREMDYVHILLHSEPVTASAYAKALCQRGTDPETLCLDVLAPAARRLGALWCQDICSFVEVTVGLGWLHQVVRELAPSSRELGAFDVPGPRILLALAPGEQHGFGLAIVRQFFLRAGWTVMGGPALSAKEATRLVRQEHFDVVGLTAASADRFPALKGAIRRLRAGSCNRSIRVMVGGQIFVSNPEFVSLVGADMTAQDGQHALLQAERLVEHLGRSGFVVMKGQPLAAHCPPNRPPPG